MSFIPGFNPAQTPPANPLAGNGGVGGAQRAAAPASADTLSSAGKPVDNSNCCDSISQCFVAMWNAITWPFVKIYEWVLSLFGWSTGNTIDRIINDPRAVVDEFIAKPDVVAANLINEILDNPEKFADSMLALFKDAKACKDANNDKYVKILDDDAVMAEAMKAVAKAVPALDGPGDDEDALEDALQKTLLMALGSAGSKLGVANNPMAVLGILMAAFQQKDFSRVASALGEVAKGLLAKDSALTPAIDRIVETAKDKAKSEALFKAVERFMQEVKKI